MNYISMKMIPFGQNCSFWFELVVKLMEHNNSKQTIFLGAN